MKIDMYTHILPPEYGAAVSKHTTQVQKQIGALWDLEERFRMMDKFDEYVQVLTFSIPPLEAAVEPKRAGDLARLGNDELIEIVTKYPDRFVAGVAILPMHDVDAALREADRAIKDLGLKGVLIYTNINGKPLDLPDFIPLYELMAHHDIPIWIHPRRDQTVADYETEKASKYNLHGALGWPYETQLAMSRLVVSGVMEKFPNLKLITHHCGGGMPFFGVRVSSWLDTYMRMEPHSTLSNLTKPPIEYLRMFYGDTAIDGNTPALECGHAFFGAEHIIFATDMPFGRDKGEYSVKIGIHTVTEMAIPESDKKKIFEENAKSLLNLH